MADAFDATTWFAGIRRGNRAWGAAKRVEHGMAHRRASSTPA
jgi:hypothetical protein